MKRELTISFALLMILFSTAIPGVYAMGDDGNREMPEMDAEQMKEMALEMLANGIDSLTELQSELEDEDLLDSVDSLLKEMETMRTELEATDDEEEIAAIMEEFRASMEEVPDEISEVLMQDGPMGRESQQPMDGDRTMVEGDENMHSSEREKTVDDNVNGETPADRSADETSPIDESSSGSASEENNGILSGLINIIKSLF